MTSTQPQLSLGAVNIACTDPQRLAEFWTAAVGGTIAGSHEGSVFTDGPIPFFLQHQPDLEARAGNTHLDLTAAKGQRQAEVDRLVALGATWQWDVLDEVPWVRWTALADPEGNLFCVAEHG